MYLDAPMYMYGASRGQTACLTGVGGLTPCPQLRVPLETSSRRGSCGTLPLSALCVIPRFQQTPANILSTEAVVLEKIQVLAGPD